MASCQHVEWSIRHRPAIADKEINNKQTQIFGQSCPVYAVAWRCDLLSFYLIEIQLQ